MKRTNNRMTIKFKEVNLKSNTFYTGIVKEVNFGKNNQKIYFFVELDADPGVQYMKSLDYSENRNSQLGMFLEQLGVLDDNNEINLKDLEGCDVQVTLNKGKDSFWYVNEMYLVEDESEEEPFDESLDDGYDPDDDDIDFDEEEE